MDWYVARAKNIALNKALPAETKKSAHQFSNQTLQKSCQEHRFKRAQLIRLTTLLPFIVLSIKSAMTALLSPHVDFATQESIVKGFHRQLNENGTENVSQINRLHLHGTMHQKQFHCSLHISSLLQALTDVTTRQSIKQLNQQIGCTRNPTNRCQY